MNKTQLIEDLAKRTGLTRGRAKEVVGALFHPATGLISEELRGGGALTLRDFGAFRVRERPARTGRDPRTGREIQVPARPTCTFRPRKGLRKSMKDIVGG